MKTAFFSVMIIALLALVACTPRPTPITISEMPTLTQARPTATTAPPTPTPTPKGRTLLVTNPADSGSGTLRQAMQDARPYDVIAFDPSVFPPEAPVTISVTSSLPELSQGNLTIDASNAGLILDGSTITPPDPQHGLSISSDHNIIRGLQITGFSDAGIGLFGGAQYNTIGGDRTIGTAALGQGNLISGNGNFGIGLWDETTSHNTIQGNYIGINLIGSAVWGHSRDGIHSNGATQNLIKDNVIGGSDSAGVYLCCVLEGRNTVTGNRIGVGPDGNPLGNSLAGVILDRTHHNVVGPGNTIAQNLGDGISFWEDSPNNTVTQNSIHDNGGRGIGESNSEIGLQPPLIIQFDMQAGMLSGAACANCRVEIFSDQGNQGAVYEGQAAADSTGNFYFSKRVAFSGPRLTSTATDDQGNTSAFSPPTSGSGKELILQAGNDKPVSRLEALCSPELVGGNIGTQWGHVKSVEGWGSACAPQGIKGLTMVRLAFNEVEDWPYIDWTQPEFDISPEQEAFITDLFENGITITYLLNFWDKANHPNGWPAIPSRFTTEEEIQRYLDYVRFLVGHFKDRVRYFELWNEPDNAGSAIQYIAPKDYVELVRRVAPVIREEYPEAKIVVGGVSYLRGSGARDWLYHIIQSDILPLVDVIAWHPMYGPSPDFEDERDYYYAYPGILKDIQDTAIAHGFQGEFRSDEIGWCSPDINPDPNSPIDCGAALHMQTDISAAKYHGRGIVMHLGMNVKVHLGGVHDGRYLSSKIVSNLASILAGANGEPLPVQIQSSAANVVHYSFILPNGDRLVALWTDGVAVKDDPGDRSTLIFPGISAQKVIGIDVLHGFEQEIIFEMVNDNLVIRNFLIKDYPIILRLTD